MINRSPNDRPDSFSARNPLSQLTAAPKKAFARAVHHGKDSATSALMTVEDSQIAIAWAVHEAMARLAMTPYDVHELTQLDPDFIDGILEGTADISDSEPLSKLGLSLGVRLTQL